MNVDHEFMFVTVISSLIIISSRSIAKKAYMGGGWTRYLPLSNISFRSIVSGFQQIQQFIETAKSHYA